MAVLAKQAALGKKKSVQGDWDMVVQPLSCKTIMQMGSLVHAEPF